MSNNRLMRIRVNPQRCEGHNRCKALAPDLFELDEMGFSSAIGDGWVPNTLCETAQLVIDNCPEGAVELIEDRRA